MTDTRDRAPQRPLDVFALRDSVVGEYRRFATSFTTIFADDIRRQVEAIYAEDRYWPEPLIQINPNYKRTTSVGRLVDQGVLHPSCRDIFRTPATADGPGQPLSLYKHQEQAIALAGDGQSYVVTTGTGSGKSLCFFIPIVNAILAERGAGGPRRTRAIVIYPMNALANSQLEELDKFMSNVNGPKPVTFARYTGQEDEEERRRVADNPPDILLTNFMMLELLMTRQQEIDRQVIGNCAGLRFLVLDELHTYRGRQGADVALLMRRVRERLAPEALQCIGTSATMASEGSIEDKNRIVADVASRLFSISIPDSNVIVETLERVTDPDSTLATVRPKLAAAIEEPIPGTTSDAGLCEHPLAIWIEVRLGITWSDVDQRWVRARPQSLTEAGRALAEDSGCDEERCRRALRHLLLISSTPEVERTAIDGSSRRGFFAFKLHQFISGAGNVFATFEPPGERVVTVDGQQFLPGQPEKRLYAMHFCRDCGHEYHPVRLVTDDGTRRMLARDIDDAPLPKADEETADESEGESDGEVFGFLTAHPPDDQFAFDDRDDDYPEAWLEFPANQEARLKSHYRGARAKGVRVEPSGLVGSGTRAWFLPGKFRFCLRCGTTQGGAAKDRNRLASLSAEGRSSATTVLVASSLRWMHGDGAGMEPHTRKLLGFTDNRQDAALQSGHFNDFLFVSLVRAGFLGALEAAGADGLGSEQLGVAQQRALGFDRADSAIRAEWLLEADLRGFNLQEAEATLRQVLSYRVWFDQRRGWRFTNPNLEQLGLVRVEYLGLEELASDEQLFADAPPILRNASPAVRARVYREVLDHLRKSMAIRSQVLEATVTEQMLSRSHSRLRAPWGFGSDEKPSSARWLLVVAPGRRDVTLRDEQLIVRGSSRSALGRTLRQTELWNGNAAIRDLKSKDLDALISQLLRVASKHGLVSEEVTPFAVNGWRLNDACVRFFRGDGNEAGLKETGGFFRELYSNLASALRLPVHPLFGFEAREHTAQVEGEKREVREKRFRFGAKEQSELSAEATRLRELGEVSRFLPVLFCSPTMELGVDISALNEVYLRNVPPTPANYAQRSGRAGRSGQAALVLTYASAQSPHDQYFFREPKAMVHGEVRPPLLDVVNRDLVDSHLQAVWLACTEKALDSSIAELILLDEPGRPLRPDVLAALSQTEAAIEARRRIERVLELLSSDLNEATAPWFPGKAQYAETAVESALGRFDKAFSRWRDLFAAAERQRDAARQTMDNHSATSHERRAAQSRHTQAMDQLELLRRGTSSLSSDFYTYRYLATEGFLPGYNFPRLPLMAYVPATNDNRGRQTYLQRPRFLALAEFGPRSLVYHEGRAYRVVRAMLSLSGAPGLPDAQLPTQKVRICKACGAGHFSDDASMCHACGVPLGDAEIVNHVFRIENVATQPAERITANDEERQRQGFELQTTFEWAIRDGERDVRRASVGDSAGTLLILAYGPGATITRLNKGLRRRKNRTQFGFKIDPVSGYWAKNDDEGDVPQDPTVSPRQWIVPGVQDRKNALFVQLASDHFSEKTVATVQHSLLRGIEAVFQLEEGELLAEPLPNREERTGFLLYEATEGGAGVLTRLVSESGRLAEVARQALRVLHFDLSAEGPIPETPADLVEVEGTACVAACYRCVMSYFNQPDHLLLDRRDEKAREVLLRLASATTSPLVDEVPPAGQTDAPPPGGREARWRQAAAELRLPSPDHEPWRDGGRDVPLVWRAHYVAAVFGDEDAAAPSALEDKGFEVVVFGAEDSWPDGFRRLAAALGVS